jgi:hypothetical protein
MLLVNNATRTAETSESSSEILKIGTQCVHVASLVNFNSPNPPPNSESLVNFNSKKKSRRHAGYFNGT